MAISIGSPATNRNNTTYGSTFIDAYVPANENGSVSSVELWFNTSAAGVKVAIFDKVASSSFTSRDSILIGSVSAGSKQTFTGLSLDTVAGDYIGTYFTSGGIERSLAAGGGGYWYKSGDNIPCTNAVFSSTGVGGALSLHGFSTDALTYIPRPMIFN